MPGWFGARTPVRSVEINPMQVSADPVALRLEWSRVVHDVAESLQRSGRQQRLRDITIVLPVDCHAVEAIELACQALMEGERSPAASDLNCLFDRLANDDVEAGLFLTSVRNVVRRIGPIEQMPQPGNSPSAR